MKPFIVRTVGNTVEVWSGYRIQFSGMERHPWQKVLKAELKEALSCLAVLASAPFAGYYGSTDPAMAELSSACPRRKDRNDGDSPSATPSLANAEVSI
jgi:hypothetical protein